MKTALMIGASRGIGLALTGRLLASDWQVTATVRKHSADLEAIGKSAGRKLVTETLDINDAGQRAALATRLQDQRFDLLFLNAGILLGRHKRISELPDEDISATFFTNAISPVRTAEALIDTVKPGGMVVFMSSILGSVARNRDGRAELYRASKAALNTLVRSFRVHHADRDVTMLLLHPGVVRTDMGGPDAPLDITTSVHGICDVIEKRWGDGGLAYVDYLNQPIEW